MALENYPFRERTSRKKYNVVVRPKTRNVQFLRSENGYQINLKTVHTDPNVERAIVACFDSVPQGVEGWTRSGATLEKLYAGLLRYDREYPELPKGDKDFQESVNRLFRAFNVVPKGGKKLRPIPYAEMDLDLNKAAGYPWIGRKKYEVLNEALHKCLDLEQSLRDGSFSFSDIPPCLAYVRTQLAEEGNEKVRLVWAYPWLVYVENCFMQPFFKALRKRESPMFYGKNNLQYIPLWIEACCMPGWIGFARDFRAFDASATPGLIQICFDAIAQNFEFTPLEKKLWDVCVRYFIHTPILFPDGRVWLTHGGVPSGSRCTTAIGSMSNFLLSSYTQLKTLKEFCQSKVLGDDILERIKYSKRHLVDVVRMDKILESEFGMNLSVPKCVISRDPSELEFLGHRSFMGRVYRPEDRMLRLMLYPEYKVDDYKDARDLEQSKSILRTSIGRVAQINIDAGFHHWSGLDVLNEMFTESQIGEFNFSSRHTEHVFGIEELEIGTDGIFDLWCLT